MAMIAGILFFVAWLVCGSAVDLVFDDWRAGVVVVIAIIVVIACAAVLASTDD